MDVNVLPPDLFTAGVPRVDAGSGPAGGRRPDDGPDVVARGRHRSGRAGVGQGPDHPATTLASAPASRRPAADMDRDGIYCHVVYGPPLGLPDPRSRGARRVHAGVQRLGRGVQRVDPRIGSSCSRSYRSHSAGGGARRARARPPRSDTAARSLDLLAGDDPAFEDPWEGFWATRQRARAADQLPPRQGHAQHRRQAAAAGACRPGRGVARCSSTRCSPGMIFSGSSSAIPNVRIVLGEAGLGWVPYLLERLDHEHDKYRDLIHDVVLSDDAARVLPPPGVPHVRGGQPRASSCSRTSAPPMCCGRRTIRTATARGPIRCDAIAASGLGAARRGPPALILWENAAASTASADGHGTPSIKEGSHMRGIVYMGDGKAELTDELDVRDPGPGEVLVRLVASGLCHTDISVLDGTIPWPAPAVLGHEGAGVVEQVRRGRHARRPGDHIVLSTIANCGTCRHVQHRSSHALPAVDREPRRAVPLPRASHARTSPRRPRSRSTP